MSANDDGTLSGAQCRAARALTDISRAILVETSGIDENVIRDFERKIAKPDDATRKALRQALETLGALFIPDDAHGGKGVRLKFNANEAAGIDGLENEGGTAAEDDVAR